MSPLRHRFCEETVGKTFAEQSDFFDGVLVSFYGTDASASRHRSGSKIVFCSLSVMLKS